MHQGVLFALLAAALFGASTPFAKLLVGQISPVMLAALLYLGSGVGLSLWYGLRRLRPANQPAADGLRKADLPWLATAILSGGIAGPVLLMAGLSMTPASSASLLLNMEGVLTAALSWFVFKENFDRRIVLGMLAIVLAGVLLSWQQVPEFGVPWGPLAILGACLCWAIDNNLTRRISASDAVQIAALKGLVAGTVNLAIALLLGATLPDIAKISVAALIGFSGYGLSLVLFVLALRHLGSARTGAYFSAAPFIGAAISLLFLHDAVSPLFWLAAGLMVLGIWLHLSEKHQHEHTHEETEHGHSHSHDLHHQHQHDFDWDGREPHSHSHRHFPISHSHAHYPDIHHQHSH
ncbi:Permease of the drug/metabolite transporter (DMT) superfamily [Collimonas arenae]|uniref:Permease of the drug/metabolite transporter (DMT) superfamily n=1 Tax=Collimonas arenae TaxID=279058 RepID=A0A0A1FCL8_9BURK|nr:DMT family transporter [Collimonas arenae]AIY41525.1 Permease of the drug/metabolite transporter (DMT) superfamily [Collimonas arenae]